MTDIMAGMIAYLKAHSGISYYTDGRVYGFQVPEYENVYMPRGCIVLRDAGGPDQRDYTMYARPRYDIFCYGKIPEEASDLDRALWDALHSLSREVAGGVLIHSVVLSGGRLPWREPDTGWPGFTRSAIVQAGTEDVT